MDGARFANAVAALDVAPKELTWRAGVDVLSLGGAKNGLPIGEAVVFFDKRLAYEFDYRCKQAGQLASKMRFLSAPWVGLLKDGALLRHAAHANSCAGQLAAALTAAPGVTLVHPVGGQRRLRPAPRSRHHGPARAGLGVLHLHRLRPLPLHVLLGDDRRRHRDSGRRCTLRHGELPLTELAP